MTGPFNGIGKDKTAWRKRLEVISTSPHLGGDIREALKYIDKLEEERNWYKLQFDARQINYADSAPDGGVDELGPV